MMEWHIFTKDGGEYTGPLMLRIDKYSVLGREQKVRTTHNKRTWKSLWLRKEEVVEYITQEVHDIAIPIDNILRIERWDVASAEGGE
jgi:hypothetical protein